MPAYNGERFIEHAIQSITTQTYCNWELIVVDDGSTDSTANIVANYRDSRIRYTYQENQGQAAALNRGLELAQGVYITTLDVDDWFTPDGLAERARFLDEHPECGVVYGDGYYCDVDGKLLERFSKHRIGDVVGDVYDILIYSPFYGTGGNVMVRREVLDKYQIQYDDSIVWCQEYDLYIRIAEEVPFGVVGTPTIWYRLHEANMTMSMPEGRRLDSLIRTRFKALNSARFSRVSTSRKTAFFSQFLVYDLARRPEDQARVIGSRHFQALPKHQQVRLLRAVAKQYLLLGEHLEFARDCLRTAWTLAPLEPKTGLIAVLAHLHPTMSKPMIERWRRQERQRIAACRSPFQMVKDAR